MFGFGGNLKKSGTQAHATVVSVTLPAKTATNDFGMHDYVVTVAPDGREAFQAEIGESFYQVDLKPAVGDVLNVRYDPKTLKAVFDLKGDMRYDREAIHKQGAAKLADVLKGNEVDPKKGR